ncbi:MAG: cytochrome c oxidase assembly protein [Alphaproteobacteria bacterium]|nr:cytochrome c oxidase assembly protein [Alphaproteobacteria bacterium]
MADKNTKALILIFGVVAIMVGLSFASVPLYDLFCRTTGFGGTTQISKTPPKAEEILERKITVHFNSDTSRDLPWFFQPEIRKISVNVGQQGLINFKAQNRGKTPTIGTAVYNVTPPKAGKYFQKTQCFCFDEQKLMPEEEMNMPVMFYIDPSIAKDRHMDDVKTITLSYSFFPTQSKELEDALEAFYNAP